MKISEAFDLYKTNYLLIKGLSKKVLADNDLEYQYRAYHSIKSKSYSQKKADKAYFMVEKYDFV